MQDFIQNVNNEFINIKPEGLLRFYNKVYTSALYLYPNDVNLILKNKKIIEIIAMAESKIKNSKPIKSYRFYYDIKTLQIEYFDGLILNKQIIDYNFFFFKYELNNDFESIISKGCLIQKETFQLLNLAYYC